MTHALEVRRLVRWSRTTAALAVTAAVALLAAPAAGVAADDSPAGNGGGGDHWVAAWATAPHGPHPLGAAIPGTSCPQQATGATNETVRNVVSTHAGGNRVRVRVSNVYGTAPLEIGAASVARSAGADQTVPGTLRELTFRGSQQVSIPAGSSTLSDPVKLTVAPLSTLALSVYVSGTSTSVTGHLLGKLSYAAPGNHATAPTLPAAQPLTCWLFTTGIDVRAQGRVQGTVVALGDSITDGLGSDFNENESYPDYLARRFDARRGPTLSVANAGISANRLLSSPLPITGEPAMARFDRDVLAQSGATDLILLEGVNDIDNGETAEEIIAAQAAIIERARAAGLRIYGATLTPFAGAPNPGLQTAAAETTRQAVNHWIRTSAPYDGVFDFDAALRDPQQPSRLLPQYNSGDGLHPGSAGYEQMAQEVDLGELIRR